MRSAPRATVVAAVACFAVLSGGTRARAQRPAAPSAASTQLGKTPAVRKALRTFHRWMKGHLADVAIPGASVAFVHDGEIVSVRAFGQADLASGRKTRRSTLFPIASISKLFTVIAVGQLVEKGQLRLEDPVVQYLPSFKPKSSDPSDPTRGQRITVQQLLSHTSGLQRDVGRGLEHWSEGPFWDRGEFPTSKEMAAKARQWKVMLPPGQDIKYSNLGLTRIAAIVEKVSGVPFEEYVTRNIIQPLGLRDTTYHLTPALDARAATGYSAKGANGQRSAVPLIRKANGLAGAVGINTTAEDLGRLASWIFGATEHDPVLKRSTLERFQKLQAMTASDLGEGFGTAFMLRKRNAGLQVGHTGTLIGHRSALAMDPKRKLAVVLLTNAVDTDREAIVDEASRVVLPALAMAAPAAPPPVAGKPRQKAWERHVGSYRSNQRTMVVTADAQGNLRLDGKPLVKVPGRRRMFAYPGQSYTANKGEAVIFAPGKTPSDPSPSFEFESGGALWRRAP